MLVIVGDPTWTKNGPARGQQSAPAKVLLEAMSKRWHVFVVHEYNSSQCCPECGAKMLRTRARSVRHWRCPHQSGGMAVARDGKRRHSAEQNKDVTASRCMLRIGLSLLLTGKRPAQFCSNRQLVDDQFVQPSPTTTTTSSAVKPTKPSKNRRAAHDDDEDDDDEYDDDGHAAHDDEM